MDVNWGEVGKVAAPAIASLAGGERQNYANAREAMRDRAFQERMSSTAWTRGVEDMRRAGLNPALAYEKGGASTPGGSRAQMEDSLGKGVSSAQGARHMQSQLATESVGRDKLGAETLESVQRASAAASTAALNQEQMEDLRLTRVARIWQMQQAAKLAGTSAGRIRRLLDAEEHGLWSQSFERQGQSNLHLQTHRMREQSFPAELELLRAQGRATSSSARHSELGEVGARNLSAMHATPWGRRVVPYMSSASGAVDLFKDLAIGAAGARFGLGRLGSRSVGNQLPRIGF